MTQQFPRPVYGQGEMGAIYSSGELGGPNHQVFTLPKFVLDFRYVGSVRNSASNAIGGRKSRPNIGLIDPPPTKLGNGWAKSIFRARPMTQPLIYF